MIESVRIVVAESRYDRPDVVQIEIAHTEVCEVHDESSFVVAAHSESSFSPVNEVFGINFWTDFAFEMLCREEHQHQISVQVMTADKKLGVLQKLRIEVLLGDVCKAKRSTLLLLCGFFLHLTISAKVFSPCKHVV